MKPIITKDDSVYYVDEADFICFVEQNSDGEYNDICDICRDKVFNVEGKTYFPEKPSGKYYSDFSKKWISAFMDAHPWMKRIMFVFNS